MEKGEALYEFINRYAYFANPANIVIENYSASDGNAIEADILLEFFRFMVEFYRTRESVKNGLFSQEEADAKLRTAINEIRLQTINKFLSVLRQQLEQKNLWDKTISLDSLSKDQQKWLQPFSEKKEGNDKLTVNMCHAKECLFQDIRRRIRRADFSADQLVKFIEDIRSMEELIK